MKERVRKIVMGSLFHDIGKLSNEAAGHSQAGYEFLKNNLLIADSEILDQVRCHHKKTLQNADLPKDSLAYLTCLADSIATGMDRRIKEEDDYQAANKTPLASIFNRLNGNQGNYYYKPAILNPETGINYPSDAVSNLKDEDRFRILKNLEEALGGISKGEMGINGILEVLETNLSFISSAAHGSEKTDISLFDHLKLTAAIAAALAEYLMDQGSEDYRNIMHNREDEILNEKIFTLYSMDISGIQDFIYTISSKGALKALRSRSFYLEIVLEHLIDELLSEISLSRASLLYSGGGHAYLLLPNTYSSQDSFHKFEQKTNRWFLETYGTALFMASGSYACSANELMNKPQGSYGKIFQNISRSISERKMKRYSAEEILELNRRSNGDGRRECSVCRRTDRLGEDGICDICSNIQAMSSSIIGEDLVYSVASVKPDEAFLPLPDNAYLVGETIEKAKGRGVSDPAYIRCYCKNESHPEIPKSVRLWVGDFVHGNDFGTLAARATGIQRIGVLRADVDNLGQAFISGFADKNNEGRYVTLSRTITFSRKLSQFFKMHINDLLDNGEYYLDETAKRGGRNAAIIYAGGDDLFIIGSWDDILGIAVDLHNSLKKYSDNTLSISAGIGVFPEKTPVAALAKQTGALETISKGQSGKNAITLFAKEHSYSWEEFIDIVLGEKFRMIYKFFSNTKERGKNFLYNLLDLLKNSEEKINLARYAYLLARLAPEKEASEDEKTLYNEFSKTMYEWMKKETDTRQTITALILYTYLTREEERN